ncbi:hypothetical protein [uncultured Sphingomonas sp.]|nr:hypothetical protein [uncultured Sphingomonas sp.]
MNDQTKPGDKMAKQAKQAVDAAMKDARSQSLILGGPGKPVPTAKS